MPWGWWLALLLLLCGAASPDRLVIGNPFLLEQGRRVTGNVVVIGSPVHIEGQVLGSVVAFGGSVKLGPRALVGKDVVVLGGTLHRAQGTRILGEITQIDLPPLPRFGLPQLPPVWLQSLLLGGLVLALATLFPNWIGQGTDTLRQHGVKALLWGMAVWVAIPASGLLLLFTLVGIVLLPLHLLASLGFAILALAVCVQWLGVRVLPHRSSGLQRLFGTLVLTGLGFIPWVGPVTQLSAMLLGGGALVRAFLRHQRLILDGVR